MTWYEYRIKFTVAPSSGEVENHFLHFYDIILSILNIKVQ
jgi:hypothetical protein